jgi:hypothetical protein
LDIETRGDRSIVVPGALWGGRGTALAGDEFVWDDLLESTFNP